MRIYENNEKELVNMSIYYIDYENVSSQGLQGVELLTENDEVNLLYSKKADNVKIDMLTMLMASKAKIHFLPVHVGTPNALDFQLVTLLFLNYKEGVNHYIISKDSGYDCCIKTAAENGAPDVARFPNIESAVNGAAVKRTRRGRRGSGNGRSQQTVPSSQAAQDAHAAQTSPAGQDSQSVQAAAAAQGSQTVQTAAAAQGSLTVQTAAAAQVSQTEQASQTVQDPGTKPAAQTAQVPVTEQDAQMPQDGQDAAAEGQSSAPQASEPQAQQNRSKGRNDARNQKSQNQSRKTRDGQKQDGQKQDGQKQGAQSQKDPVRRDHGPEDAAGAADADTAAAVAADTPAADAASTAAEDTPRKKASRRRCRRKSSSAEQQSPDKAGSSDQQTADRSAAAEQKAPADAAASNRQPAPKTDPNKPVSILSVIRRRNDVQLDMHQMDLIRDALKNSGNKQQFYNYFVKKLGQKKGIELYHSIKSSYTDLLTANLIN